MKKIDWSLVNKAYCGIQWIMECNSIDVADKKVRDIYEEKIQPIWPQQRLLNEGVLMMASYILLVYVFETQDKKAVDFALIDISEFTITKENKSHNGEEFIGRLRNSISHGRYELKGEVLFFKDFVPNNEPKTLIEFQIPIVSFGIFLTNFVKEIDRQVNS